MLVVGLVLLICLSDIRSSVAQQCPLPKDNSTKILRLVHTVFRHGQRTPVSTYPKDPYINETYSPYGCGELTNVGKEFIYEAGKWLRQRYNNFLGGELYVPDAVYLQSTDFDRAKTSMYVALAGLFPPNNTALNWNNNLNWQPIPINVVRLANETLLLVGKPCPRYDQALNIAFTPFVNKHQKVLTEITEATGMEINTTLDILFLFTNLISQRDYGLKLPKWTEKYLPHPLTDIAELTYIYNAYTKELQKFAAGSFYKKMISEWKQKRDGTIMPSDRKIFLYAAHDITIVNVLTAINAWKVQVPTSSIMAIFELLEQKETGEYGVQVYLRTSPESGAIPLKITGCDYFCPLDTLIELTKDIIPYDLNAECAATST